MKCAVKIIQVDADTLSLLYTCSKSVHSSLLHSSLQCLGAEIIIAASNCEVSEGSCQNAMDEIKNMENRVLKQINDELLSLRFVVFYNKLPWFVSELPEKDISNVVIQCR